MGWFLYVVRCSDGTLYAGITTDLARRVKEHNSSPRGARYTRTRRPVEKVAQWPFPNRSLATKAERRFKRLSRKEKLRRIGRQK